MVHSSSRPVKILLVEDNPGDARLLKEALREQPSPTELHHVVDGQAAIEFVQRQGDYATAPRPDLVLLDLNLPRKSGQQVLTRMKEDPQLRPIPIIALTTSDSDQDKRECYAMGVNAYIVKPISFDEFTAMVAVLEKFWMRTARLPGLQEMSFYSTAPSFR